MKKAARTSLKKKILEIPSKGKLEQQRIQKKEKKLNNL